MVTECDEAHADFSPGLMFNKNTRATDFDCTSYLYEPGGSFRPLAQFRGRGVGSTVSYYVNDPIGTPQELLDEDGNVVWSAIYRAYGHAEMQAGIRQPLRFQGQYADEESGLHYNRYRYYNPLSGRYLTPDPIGLLGGVNNYAYVQDPLAWIDPLGLAKACPERIVNGTKIYGKGQKDGTPGHDQFSEVIANKLAMSGRFKEIYLNRSYDKAMGPDISQRRPDIMAIDENGKVHAIELASKTDMGSKFPDLTTCNETAMGKLPLDNQGDIIVLRHPFNASDMKLVLDNLIRDVR